MRLRRLESLRCVWKMWNWPPPSYFDQCDGIKVSANAMTSTEWDSCNYEAIPVIGGPAWSVSVERCRPKKQFLKCLAEKAIPKSASRPKAKMQQSSCTLTVRVQDDCFTSAFTSRTRFRLRKIGPEPRNFPCGSQGLPYVVLAESAYRAWQRSVIENSGNYIHSDM